MRLRKKETPPERGSPYISPARSLRFWLHHVNPEVGLSDVPRYVLGIRSERPHFAGFPLHRFLLAIGRDALDRTVRQCATDAIRARDVRSIPTGRNV
jgi:hypothetical protein